ncbi:hypothetical protein RHGRI_027789 [Rhododendron griersonianum]|uniref:RRM domain-containing protein n=1 Tax=Rhododendron griersonianum TaxID=479676 RepID=A0AAV6J2V1_9ERIC|nr:hypothetical protein RHGRI_027789 [Rhododendron griersonianum]
MGDVTDKDYDATEGEGADGEQNEGGLVIDGGTELSIVPVEERNSFGEETAATQISDGIEDVKMVASQGNDTLYIGNICKLWTKELVLGALKSHGVKNIEDILLPGDTKKEGRIKGFALLEFNTHSDATAALERLRKPDVVFGLDSSANVAFAQTPIHPNQEVLSQEPHAGFIDPVNRKHGRTHPEYLKPPVGIQHQPRLGYLEHAVATPGQPRIPISEPDFGSHGRPYEVYLEPAVLTQSQPRIQVHEPGFGYHGRPHERYLEPAVRMHSHQSYAGYLEPAVRRQDQSHAGYYESALGKDGCNSYDLTLRRFFVISFFLPL